MQRPHRVLQNVDMKMFTTKAAAADTSDLLAKTGEACQEERNAPTQDPDSCPHRHTDHRGSNKFVRKTFCIDCGTYIDSVPRDLAKELQEENPWRSKEEQILIVSQIMSTSAENRR